MFYFHGTFWLYKFKRKPIWIFQRTRYKFTASVFADSPINCVGNHHIIFLCPIPFDDGISGSDEWNDFTCLIFNSKLIKLGTKCLYILIIWRKILLKVEYKMFSTGNHHDLFHTPNFSFWCIYFICIFKLIAICLWDIKNVVIFYFWLKSTKKNRLLPRNFRQKTIAPYYLLLSNHPTICLYIVWRTIRLSPEFKTLMDINFFWWYCLNTKNVLVAKHIVTNQRKCICKIQRGKFP